MMDLDYDDYEPDREYAGCRCRHNTADPERGCECGYADWICDNGGLGEGDE